MSRPVRAGSDWTKADGARLKRARIARRENQVACAKAIAREAGFDTGGQQAVSNWERAICAPDRDTVPAIDAYITAADTEPDPVGGTITTLPGAQIGDPGIGGSLEHALVARLETGPAMSEWDWKVVGILRGDDSDSIP